MELNELLDRLSSQIEAMQQKHQCKIDDLNAKLDAVLKCLEPPSVLVGTAEAAKMLDVSENTIRLWYQEGKMPPNKGKGKHLKFARADIDKMAEAKKRRPRHAA